MPPSTSWPRHGIERNRSGQEHQVADLERGRIRTDGLRRAGCGDELFARITAACDLARADAARADLDALAGAVDDGADRLQVRLEAAGTHVVGVGHRRPTTGPLPQISHLIAITRTPQIPGNIEFYHGNTMSGFSAVAASPAEGRCWKTRPTSSRYDVSPSGMWPPSCFAPRSMARSTIATSRSAREPPFLVTSSMHWTHRAAQALGHDGCSGFLEDHALARRLERSGQRSAGERDVGIDQAGEALGLVGEHHRLQEKEQLQLLLARAGRRSPSTR